LPGWKTGSNILQNGLLASHILNFSQLKHDASGLSHDYRLKPGQLQRPQRHAKERRFSYRYSSRISGEIASRLKA
jgi:hypothetical protein